MRFAAAVFKVNGLLRVTCSVHGRKLLARFSPHALLTLPPCCALLCCAVQAPTVVEIMKTDNHNWALKKMGEL